MNIKNFKNKVIIGILGGCMMVSIGALPFTQSTAKAATLSNSTITQKLEESDERQGLTPFQQLDDKLDNLVNTETITKNLKANIINYIQQKYNEMDKDKNTNEIERQTYITNKPELANELVANCIIEQDQVNIIEQVLPVVSAPLENQLQISDDNLAAKY